MTVAVHFGGLGQALPGFILGSDGLFITCSGERGRQTAQHCRAPGGLTGEEGRQDRASPGWCTLAHSGIAHPGEESPGPFLRSRTACVDGLSPPQDSARACLRTPLSPPCRVCDPKGWRDLAHVTGSIQGTQRSADVGLVEWILRKHTAGLQDAPWSRAVRTHPWRGPGGSLPQASANGRRCSHRPGATGMVGPQRVQVTGCG